MGISFLSILTIIALLLFSACDLRYEIFEQTARCARGGLGQATREIFAQTIHVWDGEEGKLDL